MRGKRTILPAQQKSNLRLNTYERMLLPVTPRNRYTFYIDEEQRAALTAIKERDGISESEQIRRAIKAWVAERGDTPKKTERPRAITRKRS
jgi:hypothetical protein